MRKGIFFALLFGAFFLLMFSLVAYYSENLNQRNRAASENLKLGKFGFIADDVSGDLAELMGISRIAIGRNSTIVNLQIIDTLPSTSNDPNADLINYKSFVEGNYALQNNLKAKLLLDISGFQGSPSIVFGGINANYTYGSLAKDSASLVGNPNVKGYSVKLTDADGDTFSSCGWSANNPGTMQVSISIPNCAIQNAMLSPSAESKFWANTTGGKIVNISIGLIGSNPYSFKITPGNSKVGAEINASIETASPVIAYFPAGLNFVGEYSLSRLKITEG